MYKGHKTDFNRTLESIRGYGVSTFDVSSSKCPILRKVLSDSIFITNIWVRIWYSRDKTVPLYRIRVFTARDVRQRAFLILFSCGFVPFLSRQRFVSRNKILQNTKHQQLAKGKNGENTLTTSNHQKGPCAPVKVASVRNSLVWNITSSISSSKRWMPKSESMSSPMPLCCCLIIHWGLLPFHYRQYAVRFQFLVDEHPPFLRPLGAHHRFSAF